MSQSDMIENINLGGVFREISDEEVETWSASGAIDYAVRECLHDIIEGGISPDNKYTHSGRIIVPQEKRLKDYHEYQTGETILKFGYAEREYDDWCCEICEFSEYVIENRESFDTLKPRYISSYGRASMCCKSCEISSEAAEHNYMPSHCRACGLCDLMEDSYCDSLEGTFESTGWKESVSGELIEYDYGGFHCRQCIEQISCWIDQFKPGIEEIYNEVGWSIIQSVTGDAGEELDEVYVGELENVEDTEEEENENSKVIKDSVKIIGEIMFDHQDKMTEGDYLKVMDHLKLISDKAR